jgi:hypothetical protein
VNEGEYGEHELWEKVGVAATEDSHAINEEERCVNVGRG